GLAHSEALSLPNPTLSVALAAQLTCRPESHPALPANLGPARSPHPPAALIQQMFHLFVRRLAKIHIPDADTMERFGRGQANAVIGVFFRELTGLPGSDRHGDHHTGGLETLHIADCG